MPRPRLRRTRLPCLLVAAVLGILAGPAGAQNVTLSAAGVGARTLDLAALRALPPETREVAFLTSRGEEKARYTGVPLWPLLIASALVEPDAHKGLLTRLVVVTGRDGYRVALSAGEIAPDFGAVPVLLAFARDGIALPDGSLRLVVPGDKRGARNVVDVVRIDVVSLPSQPKETPP